MLCNCLLVYANVLGTGTVGERTEKVHNGEVTDTEAKMCVESVVVSNVTHLTYGDFGQGERWLHGWIIGPVSFIVKMEDGNKRCCHQDQLRMCQITTLLFELRQEPPENGDIRMLVIFKQPH